MSKKAPDTRNRLDNNRKTNTVKIKKPKKIPIKNLADHLFSEKEKGIVKLKKENKPSKGELFKKANGYSKTLKRSMNKHHIETVEQYKIYRKKRKKEETKARQKKHETSVLYKRTHKSDKKSGGKKKK